MTQLRQRITRGCEGTLKVDCCGLPFASVMGIKRVFGYVPDKYSYDVTFTVDPEGPYYVARKSFCGGSIVRRRWTDDATIVCFLPYNRDWMGKRITRHVDLVYDE